MASYGRAGYPCVSASPNRLEHICMQSLRPSRPISTVYPTDSILHTTPYMYHPIHTRQATCCQYLSLPVPLKTSWTPPSLPSPAAQHTAPSHAVCMLARSRTPPAGPGGLCAWCLRSCVCMYVWRCVCVCICVCVHVMCLCVSLLGFLWALQVLGKLSWAKSGWDYITNINASPSYA